MEKAAGTNKLARIYAAIRAYQGFLLRRAGHTTPHHAHQCATCMTQQAGMHACMAKGSVAVSLSFWALRIVYQRTT